MRKPGKHHLNKVIKVNVPLDVMWVSGTPDKM